MKIITHIQYGGSSSKNELVKMFCFCIQLFPGIKTPIMTFNKLAKWLKHFKSASSESLMYINFGNWSLDIVYYGGKGDLTGYDSSIDWNPVKQFLVRDIMTTKVTSCSDSVSSLYSVSRLRPWRGRDPASWGIGWWRKGLQRRSAVGGGWGGSSLCSWWTAYCRAPARTADCAG